MNPIVMRQREIERFIRERDVSLTQHFPHIIQLSAERLIAEEGSSIMGRTMASEWCEDQFGPRTMFKQDSFGDVDRWTSFYEAFFFHHARDAAAFKMRWG